MKKMKLGIFFCILVILVGCSDKEEIASIAQDSRTQINELKEENQKLKDELQNLKSDFSVYLQQLDSTSRTIMRFINEEQFDQIKTITTLILMCYMRNKLQDSG